MLSRIGKLIAPASLRGKFLAAPVIALLTMLAISVMFMSKLNEQKNDLLEIEENDLVVVGQLSGVSARISHIHARVYGVLRTARNGAGEEEIYELSKPLLEHLVGIEELLEERLLIVNSGDIEDIYAPIEINFLKYKSAIISAVEMSTVNSLMAEEQLLEANEHFNLLVIDLQEGLKRIGLNITDDLGLSFERLNQTIELMIAVFAAAISGIFLISLYLSKTLSHDIELLIDSFGELASGKIDVEVPRITSGNEMMALANGLSVFQQSLFKIDEQRLTLEKKNQLLKDEIQEREKTEADLLETRSRFQYALDHNPTIIYSARPSGDCLNVTYVSENSRKVIGYEPAELLGDRRMWAGRFEIEDEKFLAREMAELYRHGSMVRDYRIKDARGNYKWVQDSLTMSYSDAGPSEVFGSLADITEVKHSQEQLYQLNMELYRLTSSLEEKVQERTADLEKANQDLERLSESKSEFVSIVSHDLRTPLTSVKLFTDIMLDDLDNIDEETQREYLSIISSETDRLSRLISNILDFQKISAGKMQWNDQYTNIVESISECARPFKVSFESKGIDFRYECDEEALMTVIDADRLSQVVYNLLSNALKFTEEGCVTLALKKTKSVDGERLLLTVSDTGPGLPAEQLEKVFEPFEQYDGVPQLGKGTGLGLYITQCVVDRYHGRAWVESTLGEGCNFFVELPVRHPASFVI